MKTALTISLPDWVPTSVAAQPDSLTDEARMRHVIALSRENVLRQTGGPFAAAVWEDGAPRPLAVGVNCVTRLHNSVLHAEITALMLAQQARASYSLRQPDGTGPTLFTSCEPCAMCLGAILWSGVRRIVAGATRADAHRLDFDEGPVFPESYRYLEERGLGIVHGFLRDEARAVLELYRDNGGRIYNG